MASAFELRGFDTTLLRASVASGQPHGLVATREGITIVGDMNEFFYVDSDSSNLKYVVRFRPNDPSPQPTGMSVPQAQVFNLSVDTDYVYWFERANGDAGRMRRASRLGDGTDAVTISGVDGGILFAGYFWSNSCVISSCTVSRVPVTGGATEVVATNTGSIIGVDASNLYLVQVDASSPNERILAMHADGTLETVTDYNPLGPNVNFVSTGDELFWTTSIGDLRKVPRAGGVPVVVAGVATFAPFAVTSDAILFEFSVNGYKSVPR